MTHFYEDPRGYDEPRRPEDEVSEKKLSGMKRRQEKKPLGVEWNDSVTHPALAQWLKILEAQEEDALLQPEVAETLQRIVRAGVSRFRPLLERGDRSWEVRALEEVQQKYGETEA